MARQVQIVTGLTSALKGSRKKAYEPQSRIVPAELVTTLSHGYTSRFIETPVQSLSARFPVGSRTIVLKEDLYGCKAEIVAVCRRNLNE